MSYGLYCQLCSFIFSTWQCVSNMNERQMQPVMTCYLIMTLLMKPQDK